MSIVLGLLSAGLASFLFGTMWVPVRKFDPHDGMFTQWVMGTGSACVGLAVFVIRGMPGFYPLSLLGGAFWATGNILAIPTINRLGMAIGMLMWNTVACITGWAIGRFGLLGTTAQPPASSILNYLGLAIVIVGGILFSRVKSNPVKKAENGESVEIGDVSIPYDSVDSSSDLEKEKELVNADAPAMAKDRLM